MRSLSLSPIQLHRTESTKSKDQVTIKAYLHLPDVFPEADGSRSLGFILTHGAGTGMDSKLMQAYLAGLVNMGFPCIGFEFRGPRLERRSAAYEVRNEFKPELQMMSIYSSSYLSLEFL